MALVREANPAVRTPAQQEAQKYSYAIAAAAGAVAGAVALKAYIWLNPFYLGNVSEFGSAYVAGTLEAGQAPTTETHLLTGALVGAVAGILRTAGDRYFGVQRESLQKYFGDAVTGSVAAPIVVVGKCILAPALSEVWNEIPGVVHTLTCAAAGGLSGAVVAPVGIAAAYAARYANEYFARHTVI